MNTKRLRVLLDDRRRRALLAGVVLPTEADTKLDALTAQAERLGVAARAVQKRRTRRRT